MMYEVTSRPGAGMIRMLLGTPQSAYTLAIYIYVELPTTVAITPDLSSLQFLSYCKESSTSVIDSCSRLTVQFYHWHSVIHPRVSNYRHTPLRSASQNDFCMCREPQFIKNFLSRAPARKRQSIAQRLTGVGLLLPD